MSTIQAANFSDGTSSVPSVYLTNGSAKAWASILMSTGVPSGQDDLNVTSYTDIGTGHVRINVTNSFANTAYAVSAAAVTALANRFSNVYDIIPKATGSWSGMSVATTGLIDEDIDQMAMGDLA